MAQNEGKIKGDLKSTRITVSTAWERYRNIATEQHSDINPMSPCPTGTDCRGPSDVMTT